MRGMWMTNSPTNVILSTHGMGLDRLMWKAKPLLSFLKIEIPEKAKGEESSTLLTLYFR